MTNESAHFRLEEVAPGAWAAVAGVTGACVSNAGIIDLGDRTLIFDTFMTPQAAEDLARAAESLTGRGAGLVVNSHHHSDHVRGNQVFAGVEILSTARTRELIEASSPDDHEAYTERLESRIGTVHDQLPNAESDTTERRDLEMSMETARAVLSSLPRLSSTLPSRSYDDALVVEGSERAAHILTYGGGHTDSDTFVFLPDASVVFAGDLLWVANHPWGGDGHPDEWINIIYRIEALGPELVVPGHGNVASFEYARVFTRYLTHMCDVVRQAEATGTSTTKLAASPVPPQYADWGEANRYAQTLEALGRRVGLPPD